MKFLAPLACLAVLAAPAFADRARWEKTNAPERPAGEATRGGDDIRAGGEAVGGAGIISVGGAGINRGARDAAPGANSAASGSGGGGGGGAGESGAASKRFENARVFVSNSKTGPWRENGEACRSGMVYTRTTGVDKKDPPKGCASLAASRSCLSPSNHRSYEEKEWIDRNTIQTELEGRRFPVGKFGGYLSYGSDARRVGTIALRDCPSGALPQPFPNAKASVSNSASGPFVINGKVCANKPLFVRMTGVSRSNPPLGCSSPMDDTGCWDIKNFRNYGPEEWIGPSTIQMTAGAGDYPPNRYSLYAASRGEIQFVGWATLEACGGVGSSPTPSPTPAPSCGWRSTGAVFGPCNPPASACGAGNRGATTQHCGGPWSCDCSAGSAPAPAPAPAPPPAPAPAPAPPAQGCGWTALEATFGPCNPPSAACGTGNQGATTFACGGNWACRCSAAAAPPAQRSCMWETKNFVVGPCNGPGCNANAHPCGVSNAGATGEGGGGTWTCVCR